MCKKEIHLRVSEKLFDKLKIEASVTNSNVTKTCNELLEQALTSKSIEKEMAKLMQTANLISKNTCINKKLLEQIYADLDLPQKEIKEALNLKSFYKKMKGIKMSD